MSNEVLDNIQLLKHDYDEPAMLNALKTKIHALFDLGLSVFKQQNSNIAFWMKTRTILTKQDLLWA
jgi:hypothetical protein